MESPETIVARMGSGEIRQLAVLAVAVAIAQDISLPDVGHREHVHGVIRGSAPTFHHHLKRMLHGVAVVRSRIGAPVRRRA